jgi:sugar lactone lactonase YvrE
MQERERNLRARARRAALPLGLAAMVVLTLVSCATVAEKQPALPPLVWPAPPEEPRISFVQSVSQPTDLGFKHSGWSRFANWLIGAERANERLIRPFGLALDEADNLCVTDTGANVVCYFNSVQKRWYHWERIGKIRFLSPVAIAKRGDTIFVADSALRSIVAFNTRGELLFEIKSGLERPSGLAISGERLFVVDSQLNLVLVFDLHGKPVMQFGKHGAGPGEFNFPTHVAIDSRGDLLVTDSLNGRIQMFDLQGRYQGCIGSTGDSPGHFGRPKGVAVDSYGRVYVMDALFDNLQIFEQDGRFLLSMGETGSDRGEFWLPNGIAISHDNRIFIADSYNRRIQILKYIGGK